MVANLVLLNNFLHDFSAAGWIFCTVLLWVFLRNNNPQDSISSDTKNLLKITLMLMRLSLAGIVIFGIIRALAYKTYEWSAAAGEGQIWLLIIKHIILAVVFFAGVKLYIKIKKPIGKH